MGMKKINLSERKSILLEMLDEIDKFCQNNKITYFLIGGSLLGAIRHNGFIPWDDDIDIGMKRDDYERFIESFASASDNLKIIDYRSSSTYIWPAAKAIDTRTKLIENGNAKHDIGVFIDIFPLDVVYGTFKRAVKKQKKIEIWKNILTLRNLPLKKDRSFTKNVIIFLSRTSKIIPNYVVISRIAKLSQKDAKKQCNYICNFAGAWGKNEIADVKYFEKAIKHKFENNEFFIPIGYDGYLSTVYGDYMTLPPLEKQCTHHESVAYWCEKEE